MTALSLRAVNADVFAVHAADGLHVGNLKRIGSVWKFKAIGYGTRGDVEPGGGPLTDRHNTVFTAPDAAEVNLRLSSRLA
jgi:hypothetical protein